MKKRLSSTIVLAICMSCVFPFQANGQKDRRLSVAEYRDRMAAGWIGQMVGVGWGGPTEFKWKGQIIPEDKLPEWKPSMVNQFRQDDIYVEMTFLRTLELHGFDASIRQAGIDFANSGYRLWHANRAGRDNLRAGIAPPDSGHPKFNSHADDIDYQIEADFSGLIAPGMPNAVIELGETFGRLMNYGDGLYGGQFVGAMYAEAFFEDDPVAIVKTALKAIPAKSQYAEAIRDVLAWYAAEPNDWEATWQKIEDKYHKNPNYRRFSCSDGEFDIDAKINGAYIVMGLLYGKRDFDKTIAVATRCGQDSDCNPSNAAGVLFTTVGQSKLPERFTSELNPENVFSHTAYNLPKLLAVCEKLARQAVVRHGGRIEKTADGDVFVIPVGETEPSGMETCWEPGPAANSNFTDAEKARIKIPEPEKKPTKHSAGSADLSGAVKKFAPGWSVTNCGSDMQPGLRPEWSGRTNILVTHPLSSETPCVLSRTVAVPAGQSTCLKFDTTHNPRGDWTLVIKLDGKVVKTQKVSQSTVKDGWLTVTVDLTPFAGKSVRVDIENQADGWQFEAAYFDRIAIEPAS